MRGQPDFGMYAAKTVTASISDMGEVAARLGSIVTYDKRGDVVDFDNFEEPILNWKTAGSSATCYARLDNTHVRSGSQAVKLHTEAVIDYNALIEKYTMLTGSKRLGLEISFSNISYTCYLLISMHYYDGSLLHDPSLLVYPSTGIVQLYNAAGNYIEIANFGAMLNLDHLYHTLKLVVDFDTDEYVRFLYTLHEYDISEHSIYTEEGEITPYLRTRIAIVNVSADESDAWIDDFIYTQAEP